MEITKETTVILTTDELEELIKEHLKTKGFNIKKVYFRVSGHYDSDNTYQHYMLDNVKCVGTEI